MQHDLNRRRKKKKRSAVNRAFPCLYIYVLWFRRNSWFGRGLFQWILSWTFAFDKVLIIHYLMTRMIRSWGAKSILSLGWALACHAYSTGAGICDTGETITMPNTTTTLASTVRPSLHDHTFFALLVMVATYFCRSRCSNYSTKKDWMSDWWTTRPINFISSPATNIIWA